MRVQGIFLSILKFLAKLVHAQSARGKFKDFAKQYFAGYLLKVLNLPDLEPRLVDSLDCPKIEIHLVGHLEEKYCLLFS
jgi:hypothetical protein